MASTREEHTRMPTIPRYRISLGEPVQHHQQNPAAEPASHRNQSSSQPSDRPTSQISQAGHVMASTSENHIKSTGVEHRHRTYMANPAQPHQIHTMIPLLAPPSIVLTPKSSLYWTSSTALNSKTLLQSSASPLSVPWKFCG